MSVEPYVVPEAAVPPGKTAYGRVIRERGTVRLVIFAVVAAALWYAAGEFRTYQLNQKQWPALDPDKAGLSVLGIQTKDRAGRKAPYVVRSSNKSFQIRYREEDEREQNEDDQTEESKDRGGNNPGATHQTNQGAVVPMDELYKVCPTVMTGRNFASASIEQDVRPVFEDKYWRVTVDLTPEGQSRYYQYSSKHEKEKLAFIIGDEVIACPLMEAMNTGSLTLEPIWIKADAQRLADLINKKK
jgi:preprotein translocase subunit SecD